MDEPDDEIVLSAILYVTSVGGISGVEAAHHHCYAVLWGVMRTMRPISADMFLVPVDAFEKCEERVSMPLVVLRRSNELKRSNEGPRSVNIMFVRGWSIKAVEIEHVYLDGNGRRVLAPAFWETGCKQ